MKLYTECFWDDWDRIVDIYVDKTEKLPEYINDNTTYKIVVLEKGSMGIKIDNESYTVKAPALILLSDSEVISARIMEAVKAEIVFFNPKTVRDEFTLERIKAHEFDNLNGTVIYQDFMMIIPFIEEYNKGNIIPISLNALERVKQIVSSLQGELSSQRDGFWPCRSRSFLMELLYLISFSFWDSNTESETEDDRDTQTTFSEIAEFLNEHIGEKMSLEMLTRKFLINRNKLNDIFVKESSMTCMNYLLKLRIDLAKLLLSTTQIPISEVSMRVGFEDSNYFSKVFRKQEGVSPTKFRNS